MATKEELLKQVAKLEAQHIELVNTREEQKATLIALRKELSATREEAFTAKENLSRALGYIDRINDQERPPTQQTPTYQVQPTLPQGPQLRSPPVPDTFSRYR